MDFFLLLIYGAAVLEIMLLARSRFNKKNQQLVIKPHFHTLKGLTYCGFRATVYTDVCSAQSQ